MKEQINILVTEIFNMGFITYILLIIGEGLNTGLVSDYFNFHIILAVVVASGVIKVLTEDPDLYSPFTLKGFLNFWDSREDKKGMEKYWNNLFVISFGTAALIYIKLNEFHIFGGLIAILAAVIIYILGYLILTDQN